MAQAVEGHRKEIGRIRREYLTSSMVLRDVHVQRNGNGRDYDVTPSFEGTDGHGYMIVVEIVPTGGRPIVVHSNGYYVDPRSALRLFIRQQDIRAVFPAFELGRRYQVRTTATFTLPAGGGSRFMSDAFLETAFPLRERVRTVTREIKF